MEIIVSNDLKILSPMDKIIDYIKNNLILDNPDFYKKQAMGKWTGNTPDKIELFENFGNEIRLPFGTVQDIWRLHPYKNDWIVEIQPNEADVDYKSNINLYDYQEKAVEKMLSAKNGILIMPCGAGKTQTALELAARIKGRVLWLTHTGDLLRQSKKRAENVYSIDKKMFGTISSGKVNVGESITFATVQTMVNIDLQKYKNVWDVIIVDECQHCAGSPTRVTQFYKVLSNLCCRYKFGITATLSRSDGLEKAVIALLGNVVYEVDRAAVKDTTVPIKVEWIETEYTPDFDCVLMGDGTLDYSKVVEDLTTNEKRFELVFDKILSIKGQKIVLANRVEYLNRMCEKYESIFPGKAVCLSGMRQTKKAKEQRKKALLDLNEGLIDCIFATYQLASEGLDVPNLKYVVMATPEKNERTVIQSAGRVGRKAKDKEYGTVIDFVDDFAMYKGWAKKRKRFYNKIGVCNG